jgi:hypothetical protein
MDTWPHAQGQYSAISTALKKGASPAHARGNNLVQISAKASPARARQYALPFSVRLTVDSITRTREAIREQPLQISDNPDHARTREAILTTSLPWGNEVISTEGIHRLIMTCYQVEPGRIRACKENHTADRPQRAFLGP